MADNIPVTPGSGSVVAADDVGGILHQRVKLVLGSDGVSDGDLSATNPMPTKPEAASGAALASVSNATSSFTALAANANRKGFIVHNDSTTTVFLAFAATASASAFTIRLTTQSSYIYQGPIYKGIITAIANAANGALRITELT
jgi:hypothetical protein